MPNFIHALRWYAPALVVIAIDLFTKKQSPIPLSTKVSPSLIPSFQPLIAL